MSVIRVQKFAHTKIALTTREIRRASERKMKNATKVGRGLFKPLKGLRNE